MITAIVQYRLPPSIDLQACVPGDAVLLPDAAE